MIPLFLHDFVTTFYDIATNPDATAWQLFQLALLFSLWWSFFFWASAKLIHPFIADKQWLLVAGQRDYEQSGKQMMQQMGVVMTKQQYLDNFIQMWPWTQAVTMQHAVGGLLCVPSCFDLVEKNLAASLACLGILSEIGWELQDLITWILKRYFAKGGKTRVPLILIVVLAIHHSLTSTLGIPAILNYRNFQVLHWVCFDLQAAAASTLAITEYTKLLNLAMPNQLKQFQFLTLLGLIIALWTRGVHWMYLCFKTLQAMYDNEDLVLLAVTAVLMVVFTMFNVVLVIYPLFCRLRKFWKASAEYTNLPQNVDKTTRRTSVLQMQAAAANVFSTPQDELLAALQQGDSQVTRRQTIPPSFGSTSNGNGVVPLKRSSLATTVLRSSTCNVSHVLAQINTAEYKED